MATISSTRVASHSAGAPSSFGVAFKFLLTQVNIEPIGFSIDRHGVAVLQQFQGATELGFGCDVTGDDPVTAATESTISQDRTSAPSLAPMIALVGVNLRARGHVQGQEQGSQTVLAMSKYRVTNGLPDRGRTKPRGMRRSNAFCAIASRDAVAVSDPIWTQSERIVPGLSYCRA